MIRRHAIVFTTNASGAGTVLSPEPLMGDVVLIRQDAGDAPGTATADYTLTRHDDGGTIAAITNTVDPFEVSPVVTLHQGTTVAGTASYPGVPCDGHVKLVIAGAEASVEGTIHVMERR